MNTVYKLDGRGIILDNNKKQEQKIKEVIEIIGELKDKPLDSTSTMNPIPSMKKSQTTNQSRGAYSLFFSDVKTNVNVIFKEGMECSTVDGKFSIITGNLSQNAGNSDDVFQYQLVGSDNAFTFESSTLTSQVPVNITYQAQSGLLIAFISGVGELTTTTSTFNNVPFTLTIQKATNRCHFLLTINPLTNQAPVIIVENSFTSCDRVNAQKK